jgi:hypothetical protein
VGSVNNRHPTPPSVAGTRNTSRTQNREQFFNCTQEKTRDRDIIKGNSLCIDIQLDGQLQLVAAAREILMYVKNEKQVGDCLLDARLLSSVSLSDIWMVLVFSAAGEEVLYILHIYLEVTFSTLKT